MQRREFLQGSLLLGATAMSPGMELAASPLTSTVPPRTGLVLPPLNASDLSALLYELLRDAIRMENIELIKFCLEQGADVNEETEYSWTPLSQAIETKSLDVVKFLVSQGADVNEIGIGGKTLLHEVVAYKRPLDVADIVKFFVSQGADVNAIDHNGETPLHQAARVSFLDAVKSLISLGADVNARDYHGDIPLHESVGCGYCSVELVEYLLLQGADVHAQDHYGRTALDRAMEELDRSPSSEWSEGLHNAIELLQQATGVDGSSSETEAESVPLPNKDASLTELVLPSLNESDMSSLLYYLLRDAISIKNIELIKFTLEQEADVNGASKHGDTPLHWAIWKSSLDVVKFLVSQGADIHAIGEYGRTPLHSAVWFSSLDMAKFLVSQGADVNAMGGDGKTPLLESAPYCSVEMIEYLLSQGADVQVRDSDGKTALDRATDRWRPPRIDEQLRNVIDLLQKAGGAEPQS